MELLRADRSEVPEPSQARRVPALHSRLPFLLAVLLAAGAVWLLDVTFGAIVAGALAVLCVARWMERVERRQEEILRRLERLEPSVAEAAPRGPEPERHERRRALELPN